MPLHVGGGGAGGVLLGIWVHGQLVHGLLGLGLLGVVMVLVVGVLLLAILMHTIVVHDLVMWRIKRLLIHGLQGLWLPGNSKAVLGLWVGVGLGVGV